LSAAGGFEPPSLYQFAPADENQSALFLLMITVYVLQSTSKKRRYVGITNDLKRRLREHRRDDTYVHRLLGDFVVIYTEQHPTHSAARQRERFLKSGQGREFISAMKCGSGPASGG
jgi:putative endonuclease